MISSAREQVTQYLEQQAQHLIGGLENSASGWIERILHEVAFVEHGGPDSGRESRYRTVSAMTYNDIRAERNCVAVVQALEAILSDAAIGKHGSVGFVNHDLGGLVLCRSGSSDAKVCYRNQV